MYDAVELLSEVFSAGPTSDVAVDDLERALAADECAAILLGIAGHSGWKRILKSVKIGAVEPAVASKISHKDAEKDMLDILPQLESNFVASAECVLDKLYQAVKSFCATVDDFDPESSKFQHFIKVRACSSTLDFSLHPRPEILFSGFLSNSMILWRVQLCITLHRNTWQTLRRVS